MGIETQAIRGVTKHYGPLETTKRYGGEFSYDGPIRTIDFVFDYNELPAAGTNNQQIVIPAYSKIISSRFEVLTAFTSTSTTTNLLVGLQQADGTEIDNDGLHTAAQLTPTAIATRGNFYTGAGALVGVSTGAAAGEVVVAPNVNDLLTGKARIVIEYMPEGV